MLYAVDRDEAVLPGLEWLVDDEISSSTLDIAEGHPDQVRYVVHPNMVTIPAVGIHGKRGTVGLLWDVSPEMGTASTTGPAWSLLRRTASRISAHTWLDSSCRACPALSR